MEQKAISILLVSCDADTLKSCKSMLKFQGYIIESVGTASEAIQRVKKEFFNIVIIDTKLPDMDELDALKAIKEVNEETIVILITTYALKDMAVEAIRHGAYFYMIKPFKVDQLLAAIERALERAWLLKLNRKLLTDLKAANARLRELDRLKSSFVSNVSHEFRVPLTTIKEAMSLVVDGCAGKVAPKQREILKRGIHDADRLIRLVTDLLDLSKIEAGRMEMRRSLIDLALLVKDVLKTYKRLFSKKKITLKEKIPDDMGLVWADRDKMNEVVINLLSNAAKYTPTRGKVDIALKDLGSDMRFEIRNSGIEIQKKYLGKIFDKFERIAQRDQEGTGLGLPIAKDIVELHRGRIWAESGRKTGVKIIFTLPKSLRGDY